MAYQKKKGGSFHGYVSHNQMVTIYHPHFGIYHPHHFPRTAR